MIII
jgi:electron transfer flavoprotein beta subunit